MHFIAFFVSFTVLYTLGKLFLFDCLFEPISRRNTPIFAEISKKQKTKVNLPNLCFARVPIKYAQNSHGKRQSEGGGGGDETEKKGRILRASTSKPTTTKIVSRIYQVPLYHMHTMLEKLHLMMSSTRSSLSIQRIVV